MGRSPQSNRPRRGAYRPKPETLALLKVSGNPINGLGETEPRCPSPFFGIRGTGIHSASCRSSRQNSRKCPGATEAFGAAYNRPELIPVAAERAAATPAEFSEQVKAFALAHEADDVGIARMDPLYVFEGYASEEPWVVMLGVAHSYERLKQVPSDENNGVGVCDVGQQYARGTRSSYALANLRLQRHALSRADGGCAAVDSACDCRRPG